MSTLLPHHHSGPPSVWIEHRIMMFTAIRRPPVPSRSVQPLSFRSATVRRRYPIPGTNSARDRQTTHRVLHHVTKMLLEPISCTQYYIYSIMMGGSSYNISSSLCNTIIISTVATPAAHLQCTLLAAAAAAASTVAVRAHTFMYMYRSCLLF